MKICRVCEIEKPLIEFRDRKDSKDGKRNECRLCLALIEASNYQKNKEKRSLLSKDYREKNKDKLRAKAKAYQEANKESLKAQKKKHYEENRDAYAEKRKANREIINAKKRESYKIKGEAINEKARKNRRENGNPYKEGGKRYREKNKEILNAKNRKYQEENRELLNLKAKKHREENNEYVTERNRKNYHKNIDKIRARSKERYHSDIEYKLINNLRNRLFYALKKGTKSESTENLLGCTIEELKAYLNIEHIADMDNKHLDHIIAVSLFSLEEEEEQRKAFNFRNLRLISAKENLKKNNKFLPELVIQYGIEDLLPKGLNMS